MTFSSLVFLFVFLPITFLLYWLCVKPLPRNILLVAASLVFYAYGEPVAVFIMILSIIANYFLGILCTKDKYRKFSLVIAVILNIGLLFVFKYLGFLVTSVNAILPFALPVPNISLPIGISFFTFQGLSYVIDVYRDKDMVQKKLLPVFLYISFFPQLIAGPIVKYHDIEMQLDNRKLDLDRMTRGIRRFIIGLSKKVIIANQMGQMADLVFGTDVMKLGSATAWIGAFCYMFQIYFDFSGYSDMAIGLGCIFGFDFKENFNYPYIANNMQDFWRRWHISLSSWFKEYVYIPLGGNRKGKFKTGLNKMVVFFLTGLWHGANWTFMVWGLLHGAFLLLEDSQIVPTRKKWFRYINHIYVILVVCLTFVIFRADSIGQALNYIAIMFTAKAGASTANATIFAGISLLGIIAFTLAIIFSTPILKRTVSFLESKNLKSVVEYGGYILTFALYLLCVLFLISSEYNPFIYFRF